MRVRMLALIVLTMGAIALMTGCAQEETFPTPPLTETRPVTEDWHGTEIVDDYQWLEDQEAPETRAWIGEQNAYTDTLLGGLEGRDEIRNAISSMRKVDVTGMPTRRGDLYFYSKRMADEDQPKTYVREGAEGEERVLLDPMVFAEDGSKAVSLLDVSQDGELVVYAIREGGQDEIEMHFRDVATGDDLESSLSRARYFGAELTHDKKHLVYTELIPGTGPRVQKRAMDTGAVETVFGEGYGPEKIIYAVLGEQGRYLTIHVLEGSSGKKVELWLKDLQSKAPARPVNTEIEATFQAQVVDGTIYMRTSYDAPNGRILTADVDNPAPEAWRELIPEREGAVIQGASLVGGKIFVNLLENVQSRVVSFDTEGNELGEIDFDTIGSVSGMAGSWDDSEAYFTFSSYHIPGTIYRYNVETGEKAKWFQPDIPIDPDDFEVEQVRFTSKDGTEVPMFLVHKKGLELNGKNPTLLYGYGGFRASMTPSFSSAAAVFASKGGVWAVANLRGGGEFGEEWHQAGMLDRKQNTFDDFIAAAEWLIAEGYTSSDHLGIYGGSNGGLLVGAAMTQRPELFDAVVCTYPLLDMVRYDKFLVAKYWVPEYGSASNPEQFPFIYEYSPYHRVEEGTDYPATLFITGDGDTRVAPLHARKMAALVQAKSALKRPVMLRYHEDQGHAGGTPVSQQIEDATEFLSFLLWRLQS